MVALGLVGGPLGGFGVQAGGLHQVAVALAEVGGDLAIAAGEANLASGAMVRGSQTVLPGRFWLLVPFAPLLILIGIVWLIVYLVRRNRYRFPVYPNGRGF